MNTKEAIERIKTRFDKWALDDGDIKAIQALIPELRESEDERIRKLLVWQVYRNIEDETNDLAQSVYDGIKGHDPDLEESIEDWKKCLAWLEKQKEEKGQCEGRKIVEDSAKCGPGVTVSGDEWANEMTSEDEKIVSKVKSILERAYKYGDASIDGCDFNEIYAWLEKQKENPKTVDSISADCVSDVKWADTIITRAIVALSDDVDYNRDEPCKYRREIDDLKKLRDVLCGQKEQKPIILGPDETEFPYNHPANTLEGEIKNIWSKLSSESTFVASFEGFREVILHFVNFVQKEQKPVEIHIDNPNIQKFDPDVKVTTSDSSANGKELLYVCNKSYDIGFRDGVASVGQEWSEEDERNKDAIIDAITVQYSPGIRDNLTNWLNSLRPQPKQEWGEEDEKMLNELLDHCNTKNAELYNWLKSLRPQPHWKPSEEQIEAVYNILHPDDPYYDELKSLYEDLKKL